MPLVRLGLQDFMVIPPPKTKSTTLLLPVAFARLNALNQEAIGKQGQDLRSTSPVHPLRSTDGLGPPVVLPLVESIDVEGECCQCQIMKDETTRYDWMRTDTVSTLAGMALPEACPEPCLEAGILR